MHKVAGRAAYRVDHRGRTLCCASKYIVCWNQISTHHHFCIQLLDHTLRYAKIMFLFAIYVTAVCSYTCMLTSLFFTVVQLEY